MAGWKAGRTAAWLVALKEVGQVAVVGQLVEAKEA